MIDRIEDEPVRFFLRHRAQIEAWAALESETRQVAHQAMTTVGDRLAENPPAGAEILAGDDGATMPGCCTGRTGGVTTVVRWPQ